MNSVAVHALIERITAVDVAVADLDRLRAGLDDVRRLAAWCESRKVALAAAIGKQSSFPEKTVGDACRSDLRAGEKTLARADTVTTMPAIGAALADGDVSGEHVDIVTNAIRDLQPCLQPLLVDQADTLAAAARDTTPAEFRHIVKRLVRDIHTDDGITRLQHQRHATTIRTWIDNDGMWRLTGAFDPVTGARLTQRLADALANRYTQPTPDDCPTDPATKNDWLRAHALADLIDGIGPAISRGPSITVVVDATATNPDSVDGEPVTEWGIPVEIPHRVLIDLLNDPNANLDVVIVRNGVIIHAEGLLNLGRTTRLANRAQRRALRALYPTCAIPGCTVHFDTCHIHHITWWRHQGHTDLANLIPLCNRHHHNIHDNGWQLHLTPNRTLTITLPDHTTMTTGPPRTRAA